MREPDLSRRSARHEALRLGAIDQQAASATRAARTLDVAPPGPPEIRQTVGVSYTDDEVTVALEHVRTTCLALPETTERLSHGSPTFFVRGKKTFVMFLDDHHGDGRLALWCAAPPGVQANVVEEEPERFFVPPYVGHRGWLGVRLDVEPDWDEVAGICEDAYRQVAPAKLVAELDRDR